MVETVDPTGMAKDLARILMEYSAQHGLTHDQLANKAGVTGERMADLLAARVDPDIRQLARLGHRLGIKFGLAKEPTP